MIRSGLRSVLSAFVPLAVLLAAASLACLAAYFLMPWVGGAFPFRKVITKTTQLLLVLSIFPAMVWLRLRKEELGLTIPKLFFKQLIQGFGLGLLTLLPVLTIEYGLGIHVFDETKNWTLAYTAQKITVNLALALLISLIEEPIFRGILLAGLKKAMPVTAAVVISSLYYAALHFLNSHSKIPLQELNLFSGFSLLGEAFANLLSPGIGSSFLSLAMVGIFLAQLRTRFNAGLGFCIGCHTAWVWQIKMSKSLLELDFHSKYLYLVGAYDGVIGPLVTGWLLSTIIVFSIYARRRRSPVTARAR